MKYTITIKDKLDNRKYTGEFIAESKKEAIKQAIDFYTYELDTDRTGIKVIE